jgi:hypothetical protein
MRMPAIQLGDWWISDLSLTGDAMGLTLQMRKPNLDGGRDGQFELVMLEITYPNETESVQLMPQSVFSYGSAVANSEVRYALPRALCGECKLSVSFGSYHAVLPVEPGLLDSE